MDVHEVYRRYITRIGPIITSETTVFPKLNPPLRDIPVLYYKWIQTCLEKQARSLAEIKNAWSGQDVNALPDFHAMFDVLNPIEQPRLVNMALGDQYWHGSTKLFHIQCYLQKHSKVLQQYFQQKKSAKKAVTGAIQYIAHVVEKLLYSAEGFDFYTQPSTAVKTPYSKEVLFCIIAEQIVLAQTTVTVSEVVPYFAKSIPVKSSYKALLDYCVKTDQLGYVEVPQFYSSMGLPVQFYTTKKTIALYYATQDDDKGILYKYNLTKSAKLLNISDKDTVDWLSDNVFTSEKEFATYLYPALCGYKDKHEFAYEIIGLIVDYYYKHDFMKIIDFFHWKGKKPTTEEEFYRQIQNWTDFLHDEPIWTPNGLWRIMTTLYPTRIPFRESDALLLYILILDGRFDGWYDQLQPEYALIFPERYGTMKLEGEMRTDCKYPHEK